MCLIEFNKEIVEALNKLACKAKKITTKENNIITVIQEKKGPWICGKHLLGLIKSS